MPNNKNKKSFAIFPENNAFIIKEILKDHGLEESNKDILEKHKKGKESHGAILAAIGLKCYQENLSNDKLINLIKTNLNTDIKTAKSISKDLNKKILELAVSIENSKATKKTKKISAGKILMPEDKTK